MPILKRMKTNFPLSTDWSLSQMENICGWLVPLSQISQTCELALLASKFVRLPLVLPISTRLEF